MQMPILHLLRSTGCLCAVFALTACASLLPHGKQETKTPWSTYAEAQSMFTQIIPNKTNLAELKSLGVAPGYTPNVAVLSHADLLRRLVATSSLDVRLLDRNLQECIVKNESCYALEIEQTSVNKKRIGSFWPDFFNFHRTTDITGWQFDAIIVIRDGVVIYKLWSGKPMIHQIEDERTPLGPFQVFGTSVMMYR